MQIITRNEAIQIGLKKYFTGTECKNGHISERQVINSTCLECARESYKRMSIKQEYKQKVKKYHQLPQSILRRNQLRNIPGTKQKSSNRTKIFRSTEEYKEKRRIFDRSYRKLPHVKKAYNERRNAYRKTPKGRSILIIRLLIKRILDSKKKNFRRSIQILGYSYEDFISHIESQFAPGMSWMNHGDWHIDHVIPINYFIKNGINNPSVINSLSNLRPLWASENLLKGDKVDDVCLNYMVERLSAYLETKKNDR